MSGRIEVSPRRRGPADIRSGSDYGGELVARLSQVIETLNAEWEGVSQRRFRTEAEETKATDEFHPDDEFDGAGAYEHCRPICGG